MKGKSAKALRRIAEAMTVGKSKEDTKRRYKQLKNSHKKNQQKV